MTESTDRYLRRFLAQHKAPYEMRISDWSSDVCSSDLLEAERDAPRRGCRRQRQHRAHIAALRAAIDGGRDHQLAAGERGLGSRHGPGARDARRCAMTLSSPFPHRDGTWVTDRRRNAESEEGRGGTAWVSTSRSGGEPDQ